MNSLRSSALLLAWLFSYSYASTQCPTLGLNATFTSDDCQPGSNPCALCPGDMYTLTATGNDLYPGDCINWYINDMPNFNPYNGEGTLLGCSEITAPPPDPCNPNPIFLGILVNACGQEENNEFFGLWSGGGFNVDDLVVNYNDPANDGCGWQAPSAALEAAIQDDCPGAVFVGSGEVVPGNVPVVVFTSASTDVDYDFGALCSTYGTVYILQSACSPGDEVFPNNGGPVTTTVSIGCWSDDITYNPAQLPSGNGAFVAEIPVIGTIYGQVGCTWPSFPGLPGGEPMFMVEPLDVTVAADQCNNGPYYIVGIYEPLPTGCPEVFTNYLTYDVVCPMPMLSATSLCPTVTNYNLVLLQDPTVSNGVWSGDGVNGSTFNAAGLTGDVMLTFTPAATCGSAATTTIEVFEEVMATIDPVVPVCPGGVTNLVVNFTGLGPWSFNLLANGAGVGLFNTDDNPASIPISPISNTTYTLQNVRDANNCPGPSASVSVQVSNNAPDAVLSLVGNNSVCAGASAQLAINFTGGVPPYQVVYAVNGIPQPPLSNITQNPFNFPVTVTSNSMISLVSVSDANACAGTVSGVANVSTLPSPTATLVSDTISLCPGVADSIKIKFTGIAPFIYVYQVNGVNQPVDTVAADSIFIPIHPTADTTRYTLFSVQDAGCTGTVSGNFMVILKPAPTATISGSDTICVGQSANLIIDFTGTGPFLVNYTSNDVPQLPILTSTDPFVLSVTPSVTTTYKLTSVQAGGCNGMVFDSAAVLIAPPTHGTVTGGGQICQGGSGTTVTFTFTGIGPFTFTYSTNNVPQMPITTNQSTYTIQVNPSIGTAYRIVSVTNGSGCSGTFSGVAQVFVFVPASATLSGDATFCDSAMTNITVDFNGSGPFTIEYTIDGVLQPQVFTSDDPYFLPIDINTTTVYELVSVESPGCSGIPAGTATVTINYAPGYANLDLVCNPVLNNYTVSFTVIGGAPPFTLVSGSGTFVGNQFTSNPIPSANGYNIVFHDANDCGDIVVSGPNTCNCMTEAGSMNLNLMEACSNTSISAPYLGGSVDDGDDELFFILHSNPALPLGTIFGWSATSTFSFQPGMTTGTTYYISAISGNSNGSGQIDLSDPCLSVAQGTPVIFYNSPEADMGIGSFDICFGDSIEIDIQLTGEAPFTVTPAFNGVPQNTVTGIMANIYTLVYYPTSDGSLTIATVSDAHCTQGSGLGSADIQVLPPPSFGAETINCDYATGTYTVSFAVTGTAPFDLSNLLATFNGTTFTSLPIPFGTPYFTFVTDGNNCGQDTLSGLGICDCLSDAGIMSQSLVKGCEVNSLTTPDSMNAVLDAGDQVLYILHTNPGVPIGTIFDWNTIPTFSLMPGMQTGVTYYVSTIVGNPDASGLIDLNDPCLSVASGTPVMWLPPPTASLTSDTFDICPGGSQSVLVTLTGTPPFQLTFTKNGVTQVATALSNFFVIGGLFQQNETYILVSVSDSLGCPGTASGQFSVVVHPTPQAANLIHNCDLANQTYTIEFDITTGDIATANVSNLPGTYNPVTGHFISTPVPLNQPYSFTIQDSWGCGNVTVSDMVQCQCITDAGTMVSGSLLLCPGDLATTSATSGFTLEAGDVLTYLLVDAQTPTAWTVLGVNNTPSFSFNPATMTYGTTYFIVAAAGNLGAGGIDFNDPCFSSAVGVSVVWRIPVTASVAGSETICVGEPATIPVTFTGDGPYSFTYSDGTVNQVASNISQNPYNLVVIPASSATYTITGVSGAGACVGTGSGSFLVQVNEPPQAVNIVETCDFSTETYILTFDISNGAVVNSTYSVVGMQGSLVDTSFTSNSMAGNQPYNITISDAAGCNSTLSGQPNCLCASSAGTLGNVQDACLPNGQVSGVSNGDSNLDTDDAIHYFLCSDPALLPAGILAESSIPQFGFQASMIPEVTYYMVIGVGNTQPNGNLDLNDPCLSFSNGFPVVFHNQPVGLISDTLAVCAGSNASLPVIFTGQSPFLFEYAINGVSQGSTSTATNTLNLGATNIQTDLVFTLLNVSDANCAGTVSGQGLLSPIELPNATLQGAATICAGDSIALTLQLSGADTFNVVITGGLQPISLQNILSGHQVIVSPVANTTYTISTLQAFGNVCPTVTGQTALVSVDQVTATGTVSNYNGYSVSCPNDTDGSISLTLQQGMAPFVSNWSNGNTGNSISGLGAGIYFATVTDQLGCTWIDSFM
ncbi:MAG: hypothetical protein JNJ57_07495, partial [Saprospiraceae bacterium]|nr:hypothetical protein [Saprospiraceae bacterium]